MARTYKRDSRGRFAGGGSGGSRKGRSLPSPTKRTASGKTKRQGLLTQRAAVSAAQAKLKAKNTGDKSLTAQLSMRAQKAAVTRAKNKLSAAQQTGQIRLSGRDGMIKPRRGGAKKVAKPIGWMQSATARADRADPVLAKQRKKEANALRAMPKTARRAIATESAARRVRWKGKGDLTMDKYIIAISEARMQLASNHGKRKNKLSPGQIKAIYRSMEGPARKLRLLMKDVLKGAPLPTSRVVPRGTGRRVRMALAPNRIAGRTGQGKMLQKTGSVRMKATDRAGVIRPGRRNKSQAVTPEVVSPASGSSRVPASQRPGSMTNTLRSTLRELAQSDARRIREIEAITGRPITAPKGRGGTPKLPGSAGTGKVKDALQGSLRGLAQSDARFYRELGQITQGTTAKLPGGKGSKRVKGSSRRRLPGS